MAHGESRHHGHVAELIVVTGPPGAGKTTAGRALSALFERSALVAGDGFFAFIDQGYVAPWTGEAHQQNDIVIAAAAAAAGRLAVGGYTVVFDVRLPRENAPLQRRRASSGPPSFRSPPVDR